MQFNESISDEELNHHLSNESNFELNMELFDQVGDENVEPKEQEKTLFAQFFNQYEPEIVDPQNQKVQQYHNDMGYQYQYQDGAHQEVQMIQNPAQNFSDTFWSPDELQNIPEIQYAPLDYTQYEIPSAPAPMAPLQPMRVAPIQMSTTRYAPYQKKSSRPPMSRQQVGQNVQEKDPLKKYQDLHRVSSGYYINGDPSQGLITSVLCKNILEKIQKLNINQTLLGRVLLDRGQGTMSALLKSPKPWKDLGAGKEVYLRLHWWLRSDDEKKVLLGKGNDQNYCSEIGISEPVKCGGEKSPEEKVEKVEKEKKSPRKLFSPSEKEFLMAIFNQNRKPKDPQIQEISEQLGYEFKKIKTFFANTRNREKSGKKVVE